MERPALDIIAILTPAFQNLLWLLPVLLVATIFKSRWLKGWLGEQLVRLYAHWTLDKGVYRRFHDITLDTPDGTTQIDHVFLSPFGIFVLETKNMKGWIYGGEHQSHWTQKIYKHRFKFQNPLRQNYKHLKAIEETLGVDIAHLHSVIAFVGDNSFKTALPANVTKGTGFVRYIRSFRETVFSAEEVDALAQALQTGRRPPGFATHREHVRGLRRRNDSSADRQCPKCGHALVVRRIRTGANAGQRIWACSTYPKCRMRQMF
jgi:ribosomal protein L37AE/L43A